MNISYEQIRTFVAVVEAGSFSSAARKLDRHRTTLGQVISNLEIEVNMTLFDRSGKSPRLTEHGKALYKHAKSLSDSTIAFSTLCQSIESGIESNLTVYHTDLMPVGMIRDAMRGVRAQFPNVNIHWLHRSNQEVKNALESGEADIGIVLHHHSNSISPRDNVYLINMPFKVVAHPNFFKDEVNKLRLKDLKSYRQLFLEDYLYANIEDIMMVSLDVQRIENMNILLELLKIEEGWAVVPAHAVERELKNGELVEVEVVELNTLPKFPLSILYMNHANSGPVRRCMIDLLAASSRVYER